MKNNKKQLIRAVSFLLVAGFLITSLASYFVSRASLRSGIALNELPLTSDNIYSEIQRDLIRPIFISSLMASNTFLRDWVLQGENNETEIAKYLKDIKTRYNTITSFFVSEKTKKYYYADGILKTISPDEERDKWYFRVREMKTPYEINVDPDMTNKNAITIFINYRVNDYNDNYIGAIGVGLTIEFVKKLIRTYQQKYDRNIYFVDHAGNVKLADASVQKPGTNIFQLEHSPDFEHKLKSAFASAETTFSFKKKGELIHTNVRYIDEFALYLIVEQAEGSKTNRIFKTLLINLMVCALITLVVLVLVTLTISAYQERIKTLEGIIPICMHCKEIRDDQGGWNTLEHYISERSDARFSHGICPKCMEKHYPK
ncbi:MAG: cache domain-containing protein [Proteobacteria bacterium]|nr:cache domain-containing protein [Pseudomonadota bacterium]